MYTFAYNTTDHPDMFDWGRNVSFVGVGFCLMGTATWGYGFEVGAFHADLPSKVTNKLGYRTRWGSSWDSWKFLDGTNL